MNIQIFNLQFIIIVILFYIFYLIQIINCNKMNTTELIELNICSEYQPTNSKFKVYKDKMIIPSELTIDGFNILFRPKKLQFRGCRTKKTKKISIANVIPVNKQRISNLSDYYNASKHIADIDQDEKSKTPLFTSDGFILFQGESYNPTEYCISLSDRYEITSKTNLIITSITICRPDCGKTTLCINKCCPHGEVIDMKNHSCVFSGEKLWKPIAYKTPRIKVLESNLRLHFNIQFPNNCSLFSSGSYLTSRHNRDLKWNDDTIQKKSPFRILTTGAVVVLNERTRRWDELSGTQFCMDGIQNFNGDDEFYSGMENDDILVMCENEYIIEKPDQIYEIIYTTMIFISAGFQMITLIVQCMILDKKRPHGWAILFSMISMFFTYLFLGISHIFPILFPGVLSTNYLKSIPCILVGVVTHYFLLSTFSWLTVVDYDIWKTFRSIDGLSQKFITRKRLYVYSLFGFGISGIIIIVGFCLDYIYKDDPGSEITIPKYGEENCYIIPEALGFYVYSIIGILMMINIFFICCTATNIYSVRSAGSNLQRNSKQQSSWKLFGKLFFIMGITWIFEVISWIHSKISNSKEWYWNISDIINILQPIVIFIIVVCKRKTIVQLKFKMNSIKNIVTSFPSFSRTSISIFSVRSSNHQNSSSRKGSNVTTSILPSNEIKGSGKR